MTCELDNLNELCKHALQYYEGEGVTLDYKEAFRLFSVAAEQKSQDAYVFLGIMYEEGKGVD